LASWLVSSNNNKTN